MSRLLRQGHRLRQEALQDVERELRGVEQVAHDLDAFDLALWTAHRLGLSQGILLLLLLIIILRYSLVESLST